MYDIWGLLGYGGPPPTAYPSGWSYFMGRTLVKGVPPTLRKPCMTRKDGKIKVQYHSFNEDICIYHKKD